MPNTHKGIGLRPIDQPFGAIRANYYEAVTSAALYMFQPVDLDANGRVVFAGANSGANRILGSILGFADDSYCPLPNPYLSANAGLGYTANSAGLIKVLVADDPNQYFVIEENTGGTALDAQSIGLGCSLTYYGSASGSTVNGVANVQLLRATASTDQAVGNQLRLIKKWDKPDNAFGNYCKWIVKIDLHRYTANSAGTFV